MCVVRERVCVCVCACFDYTCFGPNVLSSIVKYFDPLVRHLTTAH